MNQYFTKCPRQNNFFIFAPSFALDLADSIEQSRVLGRGVVYPTVRIL